MVQTEGRVTNIGATVTRFVKYTQILSYYFDLIVKKYN